MIFFNFHHHNSQISYGIYNSAPEEKIPEHYFSSGIHPRNINKQWEYDLENLKMISQNPKCLAIGECGLDALVNINENLQKKVFEAQILWANYIKKPVIIHCVKRFQELIPFQKIAKVPLIIHGFNKKKTIADEMLKHGFYLSFGKSVLHNLSLQTTLKEIPLEKIFLETDDADFDIAELYQKVAEIKEIPVEDVQKVITKNLGFCFALPK
ncbi:TatD family hydrolase [Cloacibacterium sp. TD35]|uniref:TatD family hydrolase n=1 Tax=Cloacibacterium sp. TD35 TaxID=2976818 RepID=UPI00237D9FAD|nr:TatD family hydrolase [Cloacibacterium sp. TD35]WDT68471.1 TatD family hydrolase [Cloacibacterium sp. TD35]